MQFFVYKEPAKMPTQLNVHMYDKGPEKGYVIVGIERPPNPVDQPRD